MMFVGISGRDTPGLRIFSARPMKFKGIRPAPPDGGARPSQMPQVRYAYKGGNHRSILQRVRNQVPVRS